MKKSFVLLLVIAVLLTLAGCGSSAAANETAVPAVNSDPEMPEQPAEPVTPAGPAASPEPVPVSTEPPTPAEHAPDAVDVDLTLLSSTMVYSEVYAMVYEPEEYIGKTVKINGLFATQEYNGVRLYACIVQDATACCAQGLEFELAGDYEYPKDYPDPGSEITVVGTFDTYTEEIDGNYLLYLVLRNARLL